MSVYGAEKILTTTVTKITEHGSYEVASGLVANSGEGLCSPPEHRPSML